MMNQFLIPFLYICALNGFFITVFKKKFEESLPMTLLSSTVLMIITGFFKKLSYGYYITFIMIIFFILYTIYKTVKEKSYIISLKNNYFTLGFILFVLIYIYIMFLHKETTFIYWDEFMHWGFMTKESFRINAFYSEVTSFLRVHKDYPPFSAIIEVLWCKLSGNYYSEPFTFRALSILITSFILPIISKLTKKDYHKAVYIIIIYLLVQVLLINDFFPTFTDSIYTDYVLGALCAYGLFVAYDMDDLSIFNILNLLLVLISTIMCKQMGLPFSILILATFFIKQYKKINKSKLIYITCLTVIPFVFYKAWGLYIDSLNISGQFNLSQISIAQFIDIVFNQIGKPHQINAYLNYSKALFNRPIILHLNYVLSVLLIGCCLFLLEKKLKSFILATMYFLGGIGYGLGMMLLYIFSFNDFEGPLLASYERYLGTYIYIGFILIVFIIAKLIMENKVKLYQYLLYFVCILFFVQTNVIKLIPKANTTSYLDNPAYTSIINSVEYNNIIYKKILIIAQYQSDIKEVAQYSSPFNDFQIATIGKPKYDGDINAWDISVEEFKNYLKEVDYLFISNTDEPFYRDYWLKITDLELLNNQLYKVNINGDDITLTYVR